MVGRKISTAAIVGAFATVALMGGCRDEANTGPSDVAPKDYAANLVLQGGDVQIGAVAAALPIQLAVKVTDAGGNPVRDAAVNWVVIGGGGFVNPPTGVSDVSGFVRTRWTLGTTLGENKVRAYLTNGFIIDSVDFKATAINGEGVVIKLDAASKPPATIPVATTVSTALSFTITDEFGHPVPDAVVNFTVGPNSGSADPTTATTDENGHVTSVWTTGTVAGPQSFIATLPGQLPITTTIIATPDSSRRISIVSGDAQTGSVGTARSLPIVVRVTDRFNNPITGEPVIFNDSIGSGNTVFPTTTTTDADGLASATWTVGALAGPQRVRVRTPGSGGQFARFTSTSLVAFRDVFAGNFSTCAVATDEHAYCWGFGQDGQLGNTALVSRNAPNWPVAGGPDSAAATYPNFREIAGGTSHTCGITLARSLMCWGFNPDGRAFATGALGAFALGVPTPTTPATGVRSISASESISCFTTLGGTATCSGVDDGRGAVLGVATNFPATGYSVIAVGFRHACGMPKYDPADAITTQTPLCWGDNSNGQVGRDTTVFGPITQAVKVTMDPGVLFDSLSLVAGASHTCALTSAAAAFPGSAFCWGSNAFGQLGNAAAIIQGGRSTRPVAVAQPALFVRLYAGENHTCGLTAAGIAYCWGRNNAGQLGNGGRDSTSAPVPVAGGLQFRSLALGELHTCGITGTPGTTGTTGGAGVIYCWGDNEKGQLGLGMFGGNGVPVLTPTRVTYQQ